MKIQYSLKPPSRIQHTPQKGAHSKGPIKNCLRKCCYRGNSIRVDRYQGSKRGHRDYTRAYACGKL